MIVRMSKVQAEAVSILIEDWMERKYDEDDWLWGFEDEVPWEEIKRQTNALGAEIRRAIIKKTSEEKIDG